MFAALLFSALTSITLAPSTSGATGDVATPRVAILPAHIEGSLTPADRTRLDERMLKAFDRASIELIPMRTVRAALERHDGCTRDSCLRELAGELEADFVIMTEVHARNRDYEVVFTLVEAEPELEISRVELACPVCGANEVVDLVGSKANVVRDRILVDRDPARLTLDGGPKGAVVELDGRRIGRLPFTGSVPPGEHELAIIAAGYYSEVVPLVAVAGAEERIEINLEPKPKTHWHRPVGWVALGTGGATLAAGVTLLALHGKAYGPRCEDPENIDAEGDCKWQYTTLGPGVGLTIAGSALVGLGSGLLVVDRRRREHGGDLDDSKSELRVHVRLSPTSIGMKMEF